MQAICKNQNGELENEMSEMRRIRVRNVKNTRNEMGMQVRRISVGMRGICVEIQKVWGMRVAMKGIKVET